MILHRNQKDFLLSPVYKHLKGIFGYARNKKGHSIEENQLFFKTKEQEKMAMNEWENDDSDILRALDSVYIKNRTILFLHLLKNFFTKIHHRV